MTVQIPGFSDQVVRVDGVGVHVVSGGEGHPLLLLHGFPQTHLAWPQVAPALAEHFRVLCPDLPGYGASDKPAANGPEGYAKRVTAATMVDLMRQLGHERFSVVGHDRGALVAFRAALDHPDVVEHLGVLDVIPTVDNCDALTGIAGVFAFHLYLLAQPTDLPERMIGADPDTFFGHFLETWVAEPDAIPAQVRAAYLAATRRPEAITPYARTTAPAPSSTAITIAQTATPAAGWPCRSWPCGRTQATRPCPSTPKPCGRAGRRTCAPQFCPGGTSCLRTPGRGRRRHPRPDRMTTRVGRRALTRAPVRGTPASGRSRHTWPRSSPHIHVGLDGRRRGAFLQSLAGFEGAGWNTFRIVLMPLVCLVFVAVVLDLRHRFARERTRPQR